jgi:hypothetical protein
MRTTWLFAFALLSLASGALAQDAPEDEAAADSWLGCWTRNYDAAHLAKNPAQKVTALTLTVVKRQEESSESPGTYSAKITASLRDSQETYSNLDGARCVVSDQTLSCFTDGFFLGQFAIERADKNRKLELRGAGAHLALVPGIDLSAFVVLSPQSPEDTLFLLQPAPAKACGQ